MMVDNNKNLKIIGFMILMREQKVEAATIPSLIGQSQQISPMWNALDVTGMVIINLNVKQI